MTSMIAENRPYEFISIKHLGIIEDGIDDTESDAARSWTPAYENYTFSDVGTSTEVKVDVDATPEFEAYMEDAWRGHCEAEGSRGACARGDVEWWSNHQLTPVNPYPASRKRSPAQLPGRAHAHDIGL
jgi:hypothetical protein